VLESVDALGALQDENQFAATARFHALRGDGAAALATADACAAALPATTRLRTYLPALMAFVKAGATRVRVVKDGLTVWKRVRGKNGGTVRV